MDVSGVLFIPFFAVAATAMLGAPVAAVQYVRWRLRAARRVRAGHCGRCGAAFELGAQEYLVTGVHICGSCAASLRERLGRGLMTVATGVLGFGALAVGAIALDIAVDGMRIVPWLLSNGRWFAVAVPSVGVAVGVSALVSVAKQANRLGRGGRAAALPGER